MDSSPRKTEGADSLGASNTDRIRAQAMCEASSDAAQSRGPQSDASTEAASFLRLPGEIRNMIYKLVLVRPPGEADHISDNGIEEGGLVMAYTGEDPEYGQKVPYQAILGVNKQIHEEALGFLGGSSEVEAFVDARLGNYYPDGQSGVAFHATQRNALENFARQLTHQRRHVEIFVAASAVKWKGAKRYATVALGHIIVPPLQKEPKPSPKREEEKGLFEKIMAIFKLMRTDEVTQWTVEVTGGKRARKNMNALKVACEKFNFVFKNC
ncbi:hypothetical protein BU16DRAFT_566112 [Lophium mytilinum]|uniref:Uncharacterized protein n=1 Tax=Lophium mytilinum TaxID=390894 RepID=A0A6A6QGP3_9PEZI|nr:hypothetical protein BU16DRAFT_566112 [Lophium mytilinum]